MAAVKTWFHRVETRTLVWLARGRTSSFVIVGTMAAASLGLASLSAQSSTAARHQAPVVSSSPLPMAAYGCSKDPDGDGHIFCDGSVAITKLPAFYGQCQTDEDGGTQIRCRGTGW